MIPGIFGFTYPTDTFDYESWNWTIAEQGTGSLSSFSIDACATK